MCCAGVTVARAATGALAAAIAADVLEGRLVAARAPAALAAARRHAFASKWRFNRGLRRLVDAPAAVRSAAHAARWWPAVFQRVIAFAGDVPAAA